MKNVDLNKGYIQLALNRMEDAKKHLEEVLDSHTDTTTVKKCLQQKDLKKVKPKFRKMVLDTWKRGENVPYGVTYLSDAPISKEDEQWLQVLVKNLHELNDEEHINTCQKHPTYKAIRPPTADCKDCKEIYKNRCVECQEKEKTINTLLDTCRSYEARIKRFQTLSRKRKNEGRRSLGFDEKLVVQYGEQIYRDKKYNGNSLESNSWSNAEVACGCGQVEEKDKEKFRLTILRYARTHKFPKNFF